jgi:hypothetical protein
MSKNKQTANINVNDQNRLLFNEMCKNEKDLLNTVNKVLFHLNLIENHKISVHKAFNSLKYLHYDILNELDKVINKENCQTLSICAIFDDFRKRIIKEYIEYFSGIDESITRVEDMSEYQLNYKAKLSKYELICFLGQPYRHVFKYQLYFKKLLEYSKRESCKEFIFKTITNFDEILIFLNKSKSDQEMIDKIERINIQNMNILFDSERRAILKDFGHLIKIDFVGVKQKEISFKNRTLLIFDKAIFICDSTSIANNYNYLDVLFLDEYEAQNYDLSRLPLLLRETKKVREYSSRKLILVNNNDASKNFKFLFNNTEQKERWKSFITSSIKRILPPGYKKNNHKFKLFNFQKEVLNCSVCSKLLLGIFYQGYKCINCNIVVENFDCIDILNTQCSFRLQQERDDDKSKFSVEFVEVESTFL